MIVVKDLRVVSLSKDFLDITWKIEDTVENVLDFDFFIQRSESSQGPFDTIGGPLVDSFDFKFRDVRAPQYNRGRQHVYRIEARHRLTGEVEPSTTVQPLAAADLITQEIRRCEILRLKEFAGRLVFVFPRRTFGQRCANCWDEIKKKQKVDKCAECFDTSFARGYLKPIQTLMQLEPDIGRAGQSERITDLGKTQHNIITGRAPILPILKAKDMVIEAENVRWRIVGVVDYQHMRSPVAQQITLLQIPDSDVEYRIPLSGIDLSTFQPTAERAFRNPMNLDSAAEGLSRTSL